MRLAGSDGEIVRRWPVVAEMIVDFDSLAGMGGYYEVEVLACEIGGVPELVGPTAVFAEETVRCPAANELTHG